MAIDIRPLTASDGELFASLFDRMDFAHAREWKGCYCRYYLTDIPGEAWMRRTGEENRREAISSIAQNRMHGYIAVEGGQCVGWVNAGNALSFPRMHEYLAPYVGTQKIGLAICFVIEPGHRNQGLARKLLAAAVEGFRNEGYDAVLGMPVDQPMADERRYRGTLNMYREAGFTESLRVESVVVMRLDLK